MTTTDPLAHHRAEAERLAAHYTEDWTPTTDADQLALAQVHATLAQVAVFDRMLQHEVTTQAEHDARQAQADAERKKRLSREADFDRPAILHGDGRCQYCRMPEGGRHTQACDEPRPGDPVAARIVEKLYAESATPPAGHIPGWAVDTLLLALGVSTTDPGWLTIAVQKVDRLRDAAGDR